MVKLKQWWRSVIYGEVFPDSQDDLPGLGCVGPDGERAVIVEECPDAFDWQGQGINNFRGNKFFGYRADDPKRERILLCLDYWTDDPDPWNGVRFYRREKSWSN